MAALVGYGIVAMAAFGYGGPSPFIFLSDGAPKRYGVRGNLPLSTPPSGRAWA